MPSRPGCFPGHARLKDRVRQVKLRDQSRPWCGARSDSSRAKSVLKGTSVHIVNRSVAGLQVPIVAVKAEAGLERRQPQNLGPIELRISFLDTPPRESDHRVLTTH